MTGRGQWAAEEEGEEGSGGCLQAGEWVLLPSEGLWEMLEAIHHTLVFFLYIIFQIFIKSQLGLS